MGVGVSRACDTPNIEKVRDAKPARRLTPPQVANLSRTTKNNLLESS